MFTNKMNNLVHKRKSFALKDKCQIIYDIQSGKKQKDVCRDRNLSKSTVGTIWKNRNELLKAFESTNAKVKKMRKSHYDDVDQALLKWFTQQRLNNVTISGPILKTKAEEFGNKIHGEFVCSESWIDRWKVRHNISSGKIVGEVASVDNNVVSNWITTVWPQIRKDFSEDDTYNADETGLFYKLTPDRTLKFKGEQCKGGKLSKERITALLCTNMSGKDKRKLLIIGKSKNPRCFKNVVRLPVDYKANSKAWMTSEIFIEYIRKWDEELAETKRKIILLVDNCPAHPNIEHLRYIKIVFMPPNTSSKLQPLDQGIIHAVKKCYRQSLLLKVVQNIDAGIDFKITLLDGINLIHRSWQKVSAQTIRNCYRHAGFYPEASMEEFDSEDELLLTDWLVKQTSNEEQVSPNVTITEDYVTIDDNLVTSDFLNDSEIISSVKSSYTTEEHYESASDEEAIQEVMPINIIAATQKLNDIRQFLQSRGAPEDVLCGLAKVETYVDKICIADAHIQSKITDYIAHTVLK